MRITCVLVVLDCALGSFYQRIIIDQILLFTQSQLFGKATFWNSSVLVVKSCAIYFEQTSGHVPLKLKQTSTWMTCMKQQPRILFCKIYCSWKQKPRPLLGTHRYPVFIYLLILRISTPIEVLNLWTKHGISKWSSFFSFRFYILAFRICSEPK